jgi:hypothetical protein
MTPDAWAPFIREFGLPLAMLGAFVLALMRKWIFMAPHVEDLRAQLATMTALFERERQDRMASDSLAVKSATASADLAEAVEGLSKTVLARKAIPERERGR